MRLSSVLLSPFYALQLASGAKSFADNPIIGSKTLNRMGLHAKRVSLAMDMADWRRKSLAHLVTAEQRREYDENGFVNMPNIQVMTEMVNMIAATRAYEANATALNDAKTMAMKALEIGR